MDIKLRHSDTWNGRFRGVRFEILRWTYQGIDKDNWNYYLYIDERQFPAQVRNDYVLSPLKDDKDRLRYEYTNCGWDNIEAHCGWTYYSILNGYIDTPRLVKIGCDYGHLWDEGCRYDEQSIVRDVKESIDMLHEVVEGLLIWSEMDGNYRTEAETAAFDTEYKRKRKLK